MSYYELTIIIDKVPIEREYVHIVRKSLKKSGLKKPELNKLCLENSYLIYKFDNIVNLSNASKIKKEDLNTFASLTVMKRRGYFADCVEILVLDKIIYHKEQNFIMRQYY